MAGIAVPTSTLGGLMQREHRPDRSVPSAPRLEPVLMTAVVCTRNRGAAVLGAVRSILASQAHEFELLVVDQSTNDDTFNALRELSADPRLVYVRSRDRGLGRAHNLALRLARSEVMAITDDDCEVPPHWLAAFGDVFREHPNVAVAFCTVRAAPHDPTAGFIPAYQCRGTTIVSTVLGKLRARGIGAGIAVRRQMMLDLGGFDDLLGPGAPFPSCDDGDVAARALLGGYEVCETDRTFVIHYGFRTWAEGRDLAARDWVAIGAAFCKPLRAGYVSFAVVPLYELFVKALWPPINDLLHLRRPRGVKRGFHFINGFVRGLAAPMNRDTLTFQDDSARG
jgi:glycosyltransferase involved in cell wall biosynthesis